MPDLTFNTTSGQAVARELMICYLNTGTSQSPVWSPIGKRASDSAMEMDWGRETSQDILGNVFSAMKKPTQTQTFDAVALDGGDSAIVKLWNLAVKDHDASALASQDCLIVHFYAGTESTPFAERYPETAIEVTSLGGEGGGNLVESFTATFGGARTTGTASVSGGVVTYTAG